MKEIIKILEIEALKLEPERAKRELWRNEIITYTENFLEDISYRKAFIPYTDEEIDNINFEISDNPGNIKDIISQIEKDVDLPGLNPASGGHIAYIPGGGVYTTALGDYLADVFNKFAGIYYAGPGAVKLENTLIQWMCSIMGYPKTALGNLTSGGSMANLIAITTARDAKNITSKNISKSVIYLTEQAHHSIDKAFRIAGLNEVIIRRVKLDSEFRMDIENLKELVSTDVNNNLNPFLIIGSAGTTNTGSVDSLDKIAEISKANNMWFHVDAAYGGFFILVDSLKEKFKGIELSDSITIDPHKGLFIAYGSGAVLVKDASSLVKTNFYDATYLQDRTETIAQPSPADLSPELTKPFRGMRLWLSLRLLGLKPFVAALHEKYWLAQYFYEKIQQLGFQTGSKPELSVMIYRYVPENFEADIFNKEIIEFSKNDGRVFLTSTTLDGHFWIRLAVLSFRTHLDTINIALEVLNNALIHSKKKFGLN